jgi:serine/threonine-protein kinase HipA
VKFWEPNEFPQLAANEYFCLKAAERCGLDVPRYRLAEDGMALVVDRFDLRPDGTYRGFEDFCVLNARRTDEKYRGSYETSVMKRFQQFANSPAVLADIERLFTLIALNCALRNGDAHLKNFGIVYDDVLGEARLAPVYDLVTTSIYLPKDSLALTLNGTTQWPDSKVLRRLGETRMTGTPARIRAILERISDAISQTEIDLRSYINEHPDFKEVGERILQEWAKGRQLSLQDGERFVSPCWDWERSLLRLPLSSLPSSERSTTRDSPSLSSCARTPDGRRARMKGRIRSVRHTLWHTGEVATRQITDNDARFLKEVC